MELNRQPNVKVLFPYSFKLAVCVLALQGVCSSLASTAHGKSLSVPYVPIPKAPAAQKDLPRIPKAISAPEPVAQVEGAGEVRVHQVATGETLYRIGKRYGVSVQAIRDLNGLSSDLLVAGRSLRIPQETKDPTARPTTAVVSAIPSRASNPPVSTASSKSVASTTSSPVRPVSFSERIMKVAVPLARLDIPYNGSWRPPGEDETLVMDCSNTTRYLYHRVAGVDIGRTASDQYHFLRLKGRAWEVPSDGNGRPDVAYLRKNLKPGDLLFWEHTYKPKREPPITHVTVFMGTNSKGQWIMAGSQSRSKGFYSSHAGGPDIYVFDPLASSGGYSTWLGLSQHRGRFIAYGRPEAAERLVSK